MSAHRSSDLNSSIHKSNLAVIWWALSFHAIVFTPEGNPQLSFRRKYCKGIKKNRSVLGPIYLSAIQWVSLVQSARPALGIHWLALTGWWCGLVVNLYQHNSFSSGVAGGFNARSLRMLSVVDVTSSDAPTYDYFIIWLDHWGGGTLHTVSVSDYSWWKQVDSRTICWIRDPWRKTQKTKKQYWTGNKPKNQPKKSRANIVALIHEYDMAGRGARDETIIIWGRRQLWGRQENFYKKPKNSRNPSRWTMTTQINPQNQQKK